MLDYEHATKLKNAGFPQGARNHHGNGTWFDSAGDPCDHESGNDDTYRPALHELIAKCGDSFALFSPNPHFEPIIETPDSRFTRQQHGEITEWVAVKREAEIVARGATPENAVANLLLALHSKV